MLYLIHNLENEFLICVEVHRGVGLLKIVQLPLSEDVNLDEIASLTENLSGADLQAILSDAQLEAVHSFLSSQKDIDKTSETNIRHPIITRRVMTSVLLNARPSVSDQERRRLYSIYDMFMSARSSLSDKVLILH